MMRLLLVTGSILPLLTLRVTAEQWPYNRVYGDVKDSGEIVPDKSKPEFDDKPANLFVGWLHDVVNGQNISQFDGAFSNGTISDDARRFRDLFDNVEVPPDATPTPIKPLPTRPNSPYRDAKQLFGHLKFPLDPLCLADRSRWWYRTEDGSCNWLKQGESRMGAVGTARVRDYNQHTYADGISKPREGPNARAVSNAFFKRKQRLSYEHTPLLLGLIEFIMHDVTYSQDSTTEFVQVPMPADETAFALNTTFNVSRTLAMPGTGVDKDKPRENVNMATTWLDVSALYGSTPEVQRGLRSFTQGKLLAQEIQARGTKSKASYLPFNTMNVPTNTRPYQDPATLFGGGDPRTNEDWMLLGVHTLLLREHNRLCDILIKQHPDWDDEQLFQTTRLVLSAKYAMIANSYQMAYWTKDMPWPRDDGFPLYRQMYGKSSLKINPANTYPWPLVTKAGKPMVVSAEMSVLYRFHEFIISSFPIIDAANNTLWTQDLFSTGFDASGFIDTGLENILRGMTAVDIPNFKSGVDESFRSAGSGKSGQYRGRPFDIVTWSIVHEREQGLPTFNQYFKAYNEQDPAITVPIRKRFEDFSTDPEMVANLKKLYKTPDDVDFVVGVQLDEQYFPGTTVPKSALIVSLFSLFGMGNSDRFSIGFVMMRCLLVDKPWDCHPSNALEDLIWARKDSAEYPDLRFYDQFWVTELDLQSHGTNLLWRLITENSEIKCVQQSPLFPVSDTNPILCALPKARIDLPGIGWTAIEVTLALIRQHTAALVLIVLGVTGGAFLLLRRRRPGTPPVLLGWPVLGNALAFRKDPKKLLLRGFHQFQRPAAGVFGLRLASLTHYVLTNKQDLELMKRDNSFELKFNLHAFLQAINFSIITKKENFDSDIYTHLIRQYFSDPNTLSELTNVIEDTARLFVQRNPLSTSKKYEGLDEYFSRYITFVVSRCVVGTNKYDDQDLLTTFEKFNDDAINAMGLSSLLPGFLQFIASFKIKRDFKTISETLVPVIEARRQDKSVSKKETAFMDLLVEIIDNDKRASDLVAIVVWAGLTNLQATFSSTVLDIINQPGLQDEITSSLADAKVQDLNTFEHNSASAWTHLRSAAFESIRLSGPITGPARICIEDVQLASDPSLTLPKGQVAALSAYHTHRQAAAWGSDADRYNHQRFATQDPPIGETNFMTWGLKGPHTCPGRWFALEAISIMTKVLLETYKFQPDQILSDDEKYTYRAGSVGRKAVGITVKKR